MDKDQKRMWQLVGRYGAVGLEMGIAVAVGMYAGKYLDGKLHTYPWLTIFLGVAGVGAAIKAVYDAVKNIDMDKL